MTILERQEKERGDRCKWLDFDCYGAHCIKCTLNTIRRDILCDRFSEIGLKHPEVAYVLCSDYCNMCTDNYIKRGDFEDDYDEKNDITTSESNAETIANEEFKDDEYVKRLYFELKKKYCDEKEEKLNNELKELEDIRNDESMKI